MQSDNPLLSRPHSVSLKVLRLSCPPQVSSDPWVSIPDHPNSKGALAYPSQTDNSTGLTPLLALPTSFGPAYVGEAFSCTLCANREELDAEQTTVSDVRIDAELTAPGDLGTVITPLKVDQSPDTERVNGDAAELGVGQSIQGLVKHVLSSAASHVLAVTVTYNEASADSKTQRAFRKVYQFVAQRGIDTKTKITDLSTDSGRKFILEAKVANLTDQVVLLDKVTLEVGQNLKNVTTNAIDGSLMLAPNDVMQLAFVLMQDKAGEKVTEEHGRVVVGLLDIVWRVANGHACRHRTDWLVSRRAKV